MSWPAAPELDIATVLGALQRHGVKFVLIGGLAGVIHGSPFPTEDVPDALLAAASSVRAC